MSTAVSKGGQGSGNGDGSAQEKTNPKAKPKVDAQSRSPTIPFQKGDRILLVGEGQFDFYFIYF